MLEFKIDGVVVQATPDNIKIIDAYKVGRKDIKNKLKEILRIASIYNSNRAFSSLYREWICHNKFYKLGLFKERTKDCDLEAKQIFIVKLFYFIFGL